MRETEKSNTVMQDRTNFMSQITDIDVCKERTRKTIKMGRIIFFTLSFSLFTTVIVFVI